MIEPWRRRAVQCVASGQRQRLRDGGRSRSPCSAAATSRNADDIADPIIEQNYLFGPSQPTRIIGLRPPCASRSASSSRRAAEYQGGNYLDEDASYQALSRAVRWPTCFDAYAKQVADGEPEQLDGARARDLQLVAGAARTSSSSRPTSQAARRDAPRARAEARSCPARTTRASRCRCRTGHVEEQGLPACSIQRWRGTTASTPPFATSRSRSRRRRRSWRGCNSTSDRTPLPGASSICVHSFATASARRR